MTGSGVKSATHKSRGTSALLGLRNHRGGYRLVDSAPWLNRPGSDGDGDDEPPDDDEDDDGEDPVGQFLLFFPHSVSPPSWQRGPGFSRSWSCVDRQKSFMFGIIHSIMQIPWAWSVFFLGGGGSIHKRRADSNQVNHVATQKRPRQWTRRVICCVKRSRATGLVKGSGQEHLCTYKTSETICVFVANKIDVLFVVGEWFVF